MSIVYYPINGYAGSIDFMLSQYEDGEAISSETITLKIAGFQENNEESSFNEVFENINDELMKEYVGHRKSISFKVVNSPFSDNHVIGSSNLENIIKLLSWINFIHSNPSVYKLAIFYRDGGVSISDAIFIGDISLQEISEKANAGQLIQLEFKDKYSSFPSFAVTVYVTNSTPEDSTTDLLLFENGDEIIYENFV